MIATHNVRNKLKEGVKRLCHCTWYASLALPAMAFAQSSVTIYGVVDTGIEYLNNVGGAKDGLARIPTTTGTVPSRWGIRGSEELGGGLRSVFVLESGFAPDTGVSNQGGRLFGRQALVGLSSAWGQVSFGRQYTMFFWGTLDTDTLGANIYGSGSLDSYIPNARTDNAISYKGKFGGFTLGATYSFGRDIVNAGPSPGGTNCAGENPADNKACNEWSALLSYEAKTWGVSAAYDVIRGGPGAFGGLSSSGTSDKRLALGAYALFDRAKLGLGLIRRDNDASTTPKSDLWYAGATYDVTPRSISAGKSIF